jgi:chaperonin cofactor prefoldin
VSNASVTSVNLSPYAEDVHEHIVEVSNNVQEVQIDTGNVLRFAAFVNQTVQGQFNIAQSAATYAMEVMRQHEGNYSMDINDAMLAFGDAQQISSDAQNLQRRVQSQLIQSQNLTSDFQYLNESLEVLLLQASDLSDSEDALQARLSNITLITDQLELNMLMINHTVIFATNALGSAEHTVRRAEYALIMVMEDIQTLEDLIGEVDIDEGSTFFSGSGVAGLESEALSPELMPDTLTGSIEWLRKTVIQLEAMFSECSSVIQQAVDRATSVSARADQINRYI